MSAWRSFGRPALLAAGQVTLIVLSVLLAFALTEWRQRQADDALAVRVLSEFRSEIALNRAQTARALEHHETVRGTLIQDDQNTLELGPAFLVDNAWETAQAAGALPHLPFEAVSALSRIHEQQDAYQRVALDVLNLLYFNNVFSSDQLPSDMRGFAPVVSDMAYFERELVRSYDEALVLLDSLEEVAR